MQKSAVKAVSLQANFSNSQLRDNSLPEITRGEKKQLLCGYHFVVTGKVRVCCCLSGSTEHINYFLNSRSTCAAEITTDVAGGAGQRSYANTKAVRRAVSGAARLKLLTEC